MKYTCIRRCQYRNGSKTIRLATVGAVVNFEEPPFEENWVSLEAKEINFLEMSESELLHASWSFSSAAKVVEETYKVELKKTNKADIVKQIIDARYRQVD